MNATVNEVGCLLYDVREHYGDNRGFFTETYCKGRLNEIGFPDIVQMNVSKSHQDTIRGMHFNIRNPQAKMLRVLQGSILDVVVDLRHGSPKYGIVESFRLERPSQSLLVPAGYAHGFWAFENNTILMYGCSAYYDPEFDAGLSLIDPQFDFPWRGVLNGKKYNLSKKDENWPEWDLRKHAFEYIPGNRFECRVLETT